MILIKKYERKSKLIWGGILQSIVPKYSYESRISSIEDQIKANERQLVQKELQQRQISKEIGNLNTAVEQYQEYISTVEQYITTASFHSKEMEHIWMKSKNRYDALKDLKTIVKKIIKDVGDTDLLATDYNHLTNEQLYQKLNQYEDKLKSLESLSTEIRIKDVSVVGATLDGFIGRYIENTVDFDHVFIDEAAYCNTAKALVAFTLNAPITFLGDHMQLPPVAEMNIDELKMRENSSCFPFLQSSLHSESFFHKNKEKLLDNLLRNKEPKFIETQKSDLNETHRFGANLAAVLNKFVYRNGFKSKFEKGNTEIIVIHANKANGDKKRENPSEAMQIQKFLQKENISDYAVLAPYRNQVTLIGKYVPTARNEQRVMTVHKSQGQEWDTVILSVSDTSDMFFTNIFETRCNALNLLNTAVSRAKKRLVIICDTNYWYYQPNQFIYGLISVGKDYQILNMSTND